jgi:hypothetical protein
MTKLLANRWFRWTLLTIALSGLGVGIYRFTPPEPMCEIEAATAEPHRLFADGRKLATLASDGVVGAPPLGPLQIWDTLSGKEIGRYLAEEKSPLDSHQFSECGDYFAGETTQEVNGVRTRTFHLVDLSAGITRKVSTPDGDPSRFQFSPNGAILTRQVSNPAWKGIEIYETSTAKLLHKRATSLFGTWDKVTDDAVIYHVPAVKVKQRNADIEIWSIHNRKVIATLPDVDDGPLFSPDGRQILVGRPLKNEKSAIQWTVWNVPLGRVVADFPLRMKAPAAISPDGRWLIGRSREGPQMELHELATGKQVGVSPLNGNDVAFSHDSRFLAVSISAPEPSLAMLEVSTLNIVWQQPSTARLSWCFFSPDSRTFYVAASIMEWHAYDCRSGQRITLMGDPAARWRLFPTPDHRAMFAYQLSPTRDPVPVWHHWVRKIPGLNHLLNPWENGMHFRMLDANTRHELFQLQSTVRMPLLSKNRRTLVTTHDEPEGRIIRCWDLNAWKPLRWALGLPTGLAAAIGIFACWRERRAAKAG